jgi:hypothetical protein
MDQQAVLDLVVHLVCQREVLEMVEHIIIQMAQQILVMLEVLK